MAYYPPPINPDRVKQNSSPTFTWGGTGDNWLDLFFQVGGRQGRGEAIKNAAQGFELSYGDVLDPLREMQPIIREQFARARGDIGRGFGAERQRVADTERRLQGRLSQDLANRGLGNATVLQNLQSGLAAQSLRGQQSITDQQSRALAQTRIGESDQLMRALAALSQGQAGRVQGRMGLHDLRLQHILARKREKADKNAMLAGGLGSAFGSLFGAAGAAGGFGTLFS
jgi:hypothetical protein